MIYGLRNCFLLLMLFTFVVTAQHMTYESISNASLTGFQDIPGPINLRNGLWKGNPSAVGSSERPSVMLIKELIISGDVDGDGENDGAVFVISSTGGSGSQVSAALFKRRDTSFVNSEIMPIGEWVQIFDAAIDSGGMVKITLVRAGEGDGMCCPGEIVQRRWRWNGSQMKELPPMNLGRLSLASLEGEQWRLESWKSGEPVDTNTAVSLRISGGRMSGRSACNQFFASVKDGLIPGDLTVSGAGATKMMCSPELMRTEDRFLRMLPSIVHFRFVFSKLHVEYEDHGNRNELIFRRDP